ncbi:MAG: helix-turn-helix transcriptional regulator [Bacteriovoracaceae bacterium]|jgi:transcriptional regulator with XRE-family HTH domain|nr:helix-turn-helix transcriptional regulator [Bacteriovoracaceae bacterium]
MGRNSSRVGELATRLKEIRLSKGLTQEEMSYKVGTTAQFISCLENGIKTPSLTMIFKICDGLEVEPSDLFKLTKLKTKPKKKAFYEKIDAVLLRASDHELRAIYKMIKLFLNE